MILRTPKLALAFALFTTMFNSSALAATEGEQYIGLQYASTTFEIDGIPDDWSPAVIVGRYGQYLSENFSLEGRLGVGLGDDTSNFSGPGGTLDVDVEIDSLFGVYGVGHQTFGDNSSVYALIGLSRGEASLSATGTLVTIGAVNISGSETETDLSYGVGVNIGISNTSAINFEYISYLSKNDFDVSAINFGFVSKF